jgi:hypothetical protein
LSAAVASALLLASGAFAASPQQIYKDYADNGRLDRSYSKGDLQRALKDAVISGYKHGSQGQLGAVIKQKLGTSASSPKGGLPFTGLDLAFMVIGAGGLLVIGFGLRRVGRRPAS